MNNLFFNKERSKTGEFLRLFSYRKLLLFAGLVFVYSFLFTENPKIGLALSGGGARGLAHIGVLKIIDEMQIPVDYISGTSTGAVIGGLYAMGYSGKEIEKIITSLDWSELLDDSISRENVYISQKRWKPKANIYLDLNKIFLPKLPQAFFAGNNLINKFFDLTYPVSHIQNFDNLKIPFRCTATNILDGSLKVFQGSCLHECLRASMSFPTVFEPFKIGDDIYIDGGILANLPAKVVKEMGADIVIGVQANSKLKSENELQTLIDVLDQTVNLNMTRNMQTSLDVCDLLISPDLEEIEIFDFNKVEKIISEGEKAAEKSLTDFKIKDLSQETKNSQLDRLPGKIRFSQIKVQGNRHLSSAKIREYIDLHENVDYLYEEISGSFSKTYNSLLFSYIYPKIEVSGDDRILLVIVKERERKQLGFDLTYNENKQITAGLTCKFTNLLQKNSQLMMNIQLGNRQALNLDYVKNFGKHWGVYFRLFPYFKESNLFFFNEDHDKVRSVNSFEIGGTAGIGIFASDMIISEIFGYSFRTRLYQDIADFKDSGFQANGLGIKLYHESLDNYVFPMRGAQIITKLTGARKVFFSDAGYRKFYLRLKFLLPIDKKLSFKYKFEYGSYFDKFDLDFDPFYIGGIDSFLGLRDKERSAPIFKVNTLAGRINLSKDLYADLQVNFLNLGTADIWLPEKNLFFGYGIKLGYDTIFGPLRIAFALDEEKESFYYLSIGYEFDAFEFSGK